LSPGKGRPLGWSRRLILTLILVAGLLGGILEGKTFMAAQEEAERRLTELFRQYVEEQCRRHPYWATQLGNHDHDDRLDDLSAAALAEDVRQWRNWRQKLEQQIDPSRLSRSAQIDYEIWKHALDYLLWQAEQDNRFRYDPRIYGEYLTDSVFLVLTQSTLPRERNVQNAAGRIRYIPQLSLIHI
jgi:uncharacterized protein (DUF885 family)